MILGELYSFFLNLGSINIWYVHDDTHTGEKSQGLANQNVPFSRADDREASALGQMLYPPAVTFQPASLALLKKTAPLVIQLDN